MAKKTKRVSPSKVADSLLAAPAALLNSKQEKQKALQRKARELAKQQQLARLKSKEVPSVEDLIADIVRVAEDPITNPVWHKFRSISRRRYELFGHFPVSAVDRQFGMFAHAKEVAGLADEEGTRMWRASRAKQSRSEHAQRYFERYLKPYTVSQAKSRQLHQPYLLLSISDTHAHYLCPFVWRSFLQAIRDLKPDGVLLNGDILDGGEISKHPQIRGRSLKLKDELAFQKEMFRQIRQVHSGDLYSTAGNHDLADRLPRYLSQVDSVISEIDDRRVDELMGLGEFNVKLFHGGSVKSPRGTEDAKPGFLLFGFYRIHHGVKLGEVPSMAELRALGRSGQSGHVHRASLVFGTTEVTEGLSWMSTPMGARHEAGYYVPGPMTAWQRGFGVAWLFPDGHVHQYPVVVQGSPERMVVEGHVYERGPDLTDPDPQDGNWLKLRRDLW